MLPGLVAPPMPAAMPTVPMATHGLAAPVAAPVVATADLIPTTTGGNIFLGEGICPLPDHLRKKILNLEYVDMAELRPESWLMSSDTDNMSTLSSLFRCRKQPVTDIAVWVQCYSSLVWKNSPNISNTSLPTCPQ